MYQSVKNRFGFLHEKVTVKINCDVHTRKFEKIKNEVVVRGCLLSYDSDFFIKKARAPGKSDCACI